MPRRSGLTVPQQSPTASGLRAALAAALHSPCGPSSAAPASPARCFAGPLSAILAQLANQSGWALPGGALAGGHPVPLGSQGGSPRGAYLGASVSPLRSTAAGRLSPPTDNLPYRSPSSSGGSSGSAHWRDPELPVKRRKALDSPTTSKESFESGTAALLRLGSSRVACGPGLPLRFGSVTAWHSPWFFVQFDDGGTGKLRKHELEDALLFSPTASSTRRCSSSTSPSRTRCASRDG